MPSRRLQGGTIVTGRGIRELKRLRRVYGAGKWRKRQGIARTELKMVRLKLAELHGYEGAGLGRKEYEIKSYLG